MDQLRKFLIAAQFLTRLPIPAGLQSHWTMEDLRDSVHMFPLIGLVVGLGASLVYTVAFFSGLPPVLAGILTMAGLVAMTGGLHEDGLADVCDGFGGGRTREQKLEIMRDSRLGSYGAIGLILSLGFRAGAIAHLAAPEAVTAALVASAALSRATIPLAMRLLPQARSEGLAAQAGRPGPSQVLIGFGLAVLIGCLALPFLSMVAALALSAVVTWIYLGMARRQIGGVTGDLLGGLQQVLEIACLAAAIA